VESYFDRNSAEDYRVDDSEWTEIQCLDFLDASKTGTLGRVLWVPKVISNARTWGKYCLFRRNT